MGDQDQLGKRRKVIPWFLACVLAVAAALFAIDFFAIKDPLLAKGLILGSMIFLVIAGLNAAANARAKGGMGDAKSRYLLRMLAVSLAYVGSLFIAALLIDEGDPITVFSVVIALVPGLAVAGYFWAIGRYLQEQQDEFLRMLLVRQSLIATALAFSAAAMWGFLENFGQAPHVDAYWWPIIWFLGIGAGAVANKVQYGTYGEA